MAATRRAETRWEGTLAGGRGAVRGDSGAIDALPVTWAARTQAPEGKTSPEELVAAAHSSCFAMALALRLGEHKLRKQRTRVAATVTLDEVDGVPTIVSRVTKPGDMHLTVAGARSRARDALHDADPRQRDRGSRRAGQGRALLSYAGSFGHATDGRADGWGLGAGRQPRVTAAPGAAAVVDAATRRGSVLCARRLSLPGAARARRA